MTREEQKNLMTELFNGVRDELLARADQWPEEWDGFELRWLAYKAAHFQWTGADDRRTKRYREFADFWLNHNLY